MGLKDIGHTLPPGFRFYPSDEELVCHYLYKKIANEQAVKGTLVEIDLHTCQPWQLPDVARLNSSEWYFFSFRDRKYATGFRANRATTLGYWKATGKDRPVLNPGTRAVMGMRKTLVFYKNRAPHGLKTEWIMHEFRLENPHAPPKEEWVLCRVFHKSRGQNCNQQDNLFDDQYSNNNNLALTANEHEHTLASYDYQNINSCDQGHNMTNTYPLGLEALEHPSTSSTHLHNNYSKLLLSDHQTKCEDDDFGFLFDCLNNGASWNFDMI